MNRTSIFGTALLLAAITPLYAQDSALNNGPDDMVIGPEYAPAPETIVDPAVPAGSVQEFVMESTDSKFYPGIKRVVTDTPPPPTPLGGVPDRKSMPAPYSRHVWVYIPKQYKPGTRAPFMVVQDGHSYMNRIPVVLDNLIAAKRVPVMIVVMPDSGGGDGPASQRGLEYDTVSGRYAEFVESELLPRVTREYGVRFTADPEGRATMGGSSGAGAAFGMAWYHPELYHRVLSYSGTFVNQQWPVNPATPRGAWEYHATLIPQTARKPLRIWMEVGEKDNRFDDPLESWHNWPLANNRMAAALRAKGYPYRYVFARDAKHADARVVAQTLPSALEWLWKGYK